MFKLLDLIINTLYQFLYLCLFLELWLLNRINYFLNFVFLCLYLHLIETTHSKTNEKTQK